MAQELTTTKDKLAAYITAKKATLVGESTLGERTWRLPNGQLIRAKGQTDGSVKVRLLPAGKCAC